MRLRSAAKKELEERRETRRETRRSVEQLIERNGAEVLRSVREDIQRLNKKYRYKDRYFTDWYSSIVYLYLLDFNGAIINKDVCRAMGDMSSCKTYLSLVQFENLVEAHASMRGVEILKKIEKNGAEVLVRAVEDVRVNTVRCLIQSGVDVNVPGMSYDPLTPKGTYALTSAVRTYLNAKRYNRPLSQREKAMSIIELLLRHGASPGVRGHDRNGATPIHLAASHGDVDLLKVLLSYKKTPPNEKDRHGQGKTALHWALNRFNDGVSDEKRQQVVTLLLNKGADINARDDNGRTPLYDAVDHGATMTTFLLDKGADPGDILNDQDLMNHLSPEVQEVLRKYHSRAFERAVKFIGERQKARFARSQAMNVISRAPPGHFGTSFPGGDEYRRAKERFSRLVGHTNDNASRERKALEKWRLFNNHVRREQQRKRQHGTGVS